MLKAARLMHRPHAHATVFALALVVALALGCGGEPPTGDPPEVSGLRVAAAKEKLEDAGWDVKEDDQSNALDFNTDNNVACEATRTGSGEATIVIKSSKGKCPRIAAARKKAKAAAEARMSSRDKLEAKLPDGAQVEVESAEVAVTAQTPEGGLDGASTGDLNREAAEIFHAIHGTAGYNRDSVVVFEGGLVDSKTGDELPDVNTGIYAMSRADAAAIDWSDEDKWRYTIDWTQYREFAHAALKKDD